MSQTSNRKKLIAALVGAAMLSMSAFALADPSIRVARLGYASGAVSFSPSGDNEWVQARINRPMVTGDRLWSDANSRAELQVGQAKIRLGSRTSLTLLNIDDQVTQLKLEQGTLNFRVRRLAPGEIFEVDTPNLAFTISQPGTTAPKSTAKAMPPPSSCATAWAKSAATAQRIPSAPARLTASAAPASLISKT